MNHMNILGKINIPILNMRFEDMNHLNRHGKINISI
jgi:hypothetical protein